MHETKRKPALLWTIIDVLERIIAGTFLLLISPVLMLVITAVAILSKRPPLVTHRRAGVNGRELRILKIRTMWEPAGGPGWPRCLIEHLSVSSVVPQSKRFGDPRVTSAFALFCRKYSVDEWPQLWQVMTGTLSLVGPRPLTEAELSRHYGQASVRLTQVKPGLVGLWQVRGRNRLSYCERVELDLLMLDNWSFGLYLRILLAAIPAVFSGRDAY